MTNIAIEITNYGAWFLYRMLIDRPFFSLGLGLIQEDVTCLVPSSHCKNTRSEKTRKSIETELKSKETMANETKSVDNGASTSSKKPMKKKKC